MKYRFLSPAASELEQAATYYESQVVGLGADFIDEADAAIDRILRFPESWGKLSDGYRHCNFRRFPYTIIYRMPSVDEILIVSVFHQSRAPFSWQENL